MSTDGKKILFALTGSIACYKSCTAISRLVQAGMEVQTVCTPSALKFIGQSTLEALSGKPIYSDMFAASGNIEHIALTDWYDLAIVCPATGNIINKMAAGIADDPVSCLFLAHNFERPWLVAPAMNARMLTHPRTNNSLAVLESWGVKVLETGTGYQACGTIGPGRLLEPELIIDIILKELEELP